MPAPKLQRCGNNCPVWSFLDIIRRSFSPIIHPAHLCSCSVDHLNTVSKIHCRDNVLEASAPLTAFPSFGCSATLPPTTTIATMTTKQPPTARIGLLLLAAILGNPALMMTHAQGASSEVEFSYDPASDVGPEFWKDLEIENNQCGGTSNSPIALETAKCTSFADYKFTVRVYESTRKRARRPTSGLVFFNLYTTSYTIRLLTLRDSSRRGRARMRNTVSSSTITSSRRAPPSTARATPPPL